MSIIGREKYLKRIKNYAVSEPENKAFFGVKGLGKTSIIDEVFSKSNCMSFAEDYHYLYVKTILNQGRKGEDLVNFLIDKIINATDLISDEQIRINIQDKIKRDSEKYHSKDSVLTEALQCIKDEGYDVILIMDDFHNMGRNSEVGSEQYDFLRSLNETGLISYWIISDSDFSDVYATEQFTTSFFAQKFLPETMPQMSKDDMLKLINKQAEKLDIDLANDDQLIFGVIGGIPGLVDSAVRCYESFEGRDINDDELIDAILAFTKSQSILTVWSRSLTSEQKEILSELADQERIYQKEYQDKGIIGKVNQLGDNSGLGLLVHSSDENGVYWTINSRVYMEFIRRKRELFDGAVIKQASNDGNDRVTQTTYIQNNYYTVNNIFSADNALEALVDLKKLAIGGTQLLLPNKDAYSSAIQQLPFQQEGWEVLDVDQKEEQATAYADKVFSTGEFKTDSLSETQMKRFFLTQSIMDDLTETSRGNLISAIQVYDLLQMCIDRFGLNMNNSESARGILFAKLYESILKECLKPAFDSVDEIANVELELDKFNKSRVVDYPATKMTIGNFTFVLKHQEVQQQLANICTNGIGRVENDSKWWKHHQSNMVQITNLRNECCHSGNKFNYSELERLLKCMFERGAIASVEIYKDITERVII